MKRKVGTLIDEEVIRHAKRRAAEEGRPLNDVIQDTLVSYLSDKAPDPKKRETAYQAFCGQPMRISKKQFKETLEEDAWDL
jgi:hypothetical protein